MTGHRKAEVHLVRLPARADAEQLAGAARGLWRAMRLERIVGRGALVAVKQHFGEEGSPNYLPAAVARTIGACVREAGGKPFATDSNTLYNGRRANAVDHLELARRHGFSHETLGFPVIIADGLKGEGQLALDGEGPVLEKVFLAGAGSLADAAIVLTHVTGHMAAGMGGSIKNVAMGFAGRAGKLQQHHDAEPIFSSGRCKACGRCARHCPTAAVTVKEYAVLDAARCIGCGECYAFCPHGAVSFDWSATSEGLQRKMAEYCRAFHAEKDGRAAYMNFVTCVTRNCDCMGESEEGLPDLGVLGALDPVAADAAALDLLNRREGRDVFGDFWPQCDARVQLAHGERIGLGTTRYELIETPAAATMRCPEKGGA